jgi:hypothetical protein
MRHPLVRFHARINRVADEIFSEASAGWHLERGSPAVSSGGVLELHEPIAMYSRMYVMSVERLRRDQPTGVRHPGAQSETAPA